ncbi:MAG: hypothetical protein IT182_07915, partial [Acidobacteria bacterium]|nr:hypothetical protein [Acidobacteriota bacterium]
MDHADSIRTLAGYVNQFAIGVVTAGQLVVEFGRYAGFAFYGIRAALFSVLGVLGDVLEGLYSLIEGAVETAGELPGALGRGFREMLPGLRDARAQLEGFADSFHQTAAGAVDDAAAWDHGATVIATALGNAKAAMLGAAQAHDATAASATRARVSTREFGTQQTLTAAEAKKLADEVARQRQALESLGFVTRDTVNESIAEFDLLLQRGTREGINANAMLSAMLPKLVELERRARASGISTADLSAIITDIRTTLASAAPTLDAFLSTDPSRTLLRAGLQRITAEMLAVTTETTLATNAMHFFGFQTQAELDRRVKDARRAHADLVASRTATASQLAAAAAQVAEAERAAAHRTAVGWNEALSASAAGFQQLAQVADGEMAEISRSIGTGIAAAAQFKESLTSIQKGDFASVATGVAGIVSAVVSIGQMIWNAFTTPEWKKVMTDVGRRWGVDISEGLAKEIEADEKALIKNAAESTAADVGVRMGRVIGRQLIQQAGFTVRELAELLNLSQIIEEGGGLTAQNLDTWIGRSNRLFDAVALGGRNGALATRELSTLIDQFTDQANAAGGRWSQAFKDLLARAKQAGVAIDQVTAALNEQFDRAAGGTQKIVDGFASTLPDLKQLREDLAKDETLTEQEREARVRATTEAIVASRQDEFDRLSRITLAGFNAYIAQGHSAADASRVFGESIDQLIAKQQALGFAGSAAFDQLARMRQLVATTQPLLDQVGGLTELMIALDNVGGLTTETFRDLEAQGLDTFKKLTEAGFTEKEAHEQIKPMIEHLIRLSQERGLALDEETQKIVEQMKADGTLREQEASTQQVMKEGFSAMLQAMGHDIPEAWKKTAQAAKDAADEIEQQATKKITGGLDTVKDRLANGTVWDVWARNAREAAKAVSAEVDAVSFGHSPGGLKEIPLMLRKASLTDWSRIAIDDLERVQAVVDRFNAPAAVLKAIDGSIAEGDAGRGAISSTN